MENPLFPDQHQKDVRRVAAYSLVVAIGLMIGVGLYLHFQTPAVVPTPAPKTPVAATPSYFTDFYGLIRQVTDTGLVLEATIVQPSGQRVAKQYTVLVNDKTAVQQLSTDGQATDLPLHDLQVGELVQAFGTENLGPIDHFAATRIILVKNS